MDLRTLINEALDSSRSADPNVVAAEVAASIPSNQVRAALAQALPALVLTVATSRRNRAMSALPQPNDEVGSRRWRGAAREVHSLLLERLSVGAEGWKFLRDCHRDDLLAAVEHKRRHAAGVLVQAEKLEAIAALMESAGAVTVADLGEDAVREVLAA
jgi:hypothetical protein